MDRETKEIKLAVIGGDLRSLTAAGRLSERFTVSVYGFRGSGIFHHKLKALILFHVESNGIFLTETFFHRMIHTVEIFGTYRKIHGSIKIALWSFTFGPRIHIIDG